MRSLPSVFFRPIAHTFRRNLQQSNTIPSIGICVSPCLSSHIGLLTHALWHHIKDMTSWCGKYSFAPVIIPNCQSPVSYRLFGPKGPWSSINVPIEIRIMQPQYLYISAGTLLGYFSRIRVGCLITCSGFSDTDTVVIQLNNIATSPRFCIVSHWLWWVCRFLVWLWTWSGGRGQWYFLPESVLPNRCKVAEGPCTAHYWCIYIIQAPQVKSSQRILTIWCRVWWEFLLREARSWRALYVSTNR